ncbi:type I-C CRISPR-associated protein Cas8c/Csd1 [Pontiellaceae bacterium B12219]|nr:type I-C CRISPR-associated protein Cas8c/Csd1 [Pontiellaceae bacterium B12219]
MILQALAQYYDRLLHDPKINIAPLGFEQKKIDFLILLTEQGTFSALWDLREGTGKKKQGRMTRVPKGVKRTVGVAANLLWDTAPYALGHLLRSDKKAKLAYRGKGAAKRLDLSKSKKELAKMKARLPKQYAAFIEEIEKTFEGCDDAGIRAVLAFLRTAEFDVLFAHPLWQEVEASGGNLTFALEDGEMICQRPAVVRAIVEQAKPSTGGQVCAVRGEPDELAELHTAIKGVWGAQSSGANIVSFNLDAVSSFGKKQGHNAPIGKQAEFAYTTALNYLLASDRQRMQVGDASTVFWARDPSDFEQTFISCFEQPQKGEEAVKYDKIRSLLRSVKSGVPAEDEMRPFYVLGLAPNAARISIRFWYEGNLKQIKERMARFFEEIEMVRSKRDPEFLSLLQLLSSTATEGKIDNLPPNIAGDFARAVFMGGNYPRTLLSNAVRRCKAEQRVTYARVSIIKACLVRNAQFPNLTNQEVSVALDKTYDDMGYVLGRLFAVLERIQEKAQPGINKTIRDTYFGAATSSPQITFKRLDELSIHHLAKIRNGGQSIVWYERLKQEVYDLIPASGIRNQLTLEEQARFAVGYYHQRQDFFTKKEIEGEV